ncbi:membrane protein containing CHASE2 [Candidatus Magnetoovum chiemensis]|nr:membrane protein containing CHASE2 [Candidatus Magnetoovum chiemensis]
MKNKLLASLTEGIGVGLIVAFLVIALGFLDFVGNLELFTLDLRYRLRPPIKTHSDAAYIDFSNKAIELYGKLPWPRYRQVAIVKTLDFYDAQMAGYDVYFVENQDRIFYPDRLTAFLSAKQEEQTKIPISELINVSFRNSDDEFADAVKTAGMVYIAYYTQVVDSSDNIDDILNSTREIKDGFTIQKKEAMIELEKSFLPPPDGLEKHLYKSVDIDPPLKKFILASAGSGFAQPGVDKDSIVRNYIMVRYYDEKILYPLALVMLSKILDFKLEDIVIEPAKYMIIKNTLEYNTKKRQDLYIPIDERCQTLLNWAGPFNEKYLHVPFWMISYYYAYIVSKEALNSAVKDSDFLTFEQIKQRILLPLREETIVPEDRADKISKELAAAYLIQRGLERGGSVSDIQSAVKSASNMSNSELSMISEIISIALKMKQEIQQKPSLTFDNFIESQTYSHADRNHLDEVFRNVKWFYDKKRLDEVNPLYFPPRSHAVKDSAVVELSPLDIEGKIFLIGLTGAGTIDINPSPYDEAVPMVSYHLNALNSMLTGNFLHHPNKNYKYIATVGLSIFAGISASALSLPISLSLLIVALIGYILSTYHLWVSKGYWLNWVLPLSGLIFTYITVVFINFFRAFREKSKVREIFSKMVSGDVLKVMEDNPDKFSLTGERRAATMFFSMINGIGDITKTVSPDELPALLSTYLTPNSEIIMDYSGYIDKYEGHVIMADFGVPIDDEHSAWKCAYASVELKNDNKAFKYYVLAKYGLEVGISMGFNFGYVSAGNMGSERKFQYTVMGDPVNVAARFMAANSIYNTSNALTGGDTVNEISDYVHLNQIDRILLKGKTRPTSVYEVLGWKTDAYNKLRAKRAVHDYLNVLWSQCPPGKIFGYYYLWSDKFASLGHPMCKKIADFFQSNLDTAGQMMELEWKKELATYYTSIRIIMSSLKKHTLNTAAGSINKGGRVEVIDNWIKIINDVLNTIAQDKHDSLHNINAFYSDAALLSYKLEMLKSRLSSNIYLDDRIEKALNLAMSYVDSLEDANADKLDSMLNENKKIYRDKALEFMKWIKSKQAQYHEMMALAGAPSEDELKSAYLYNRALELYFKRQWNEALDKLESAKEILTYSPAIESLAERIVLYKKNPPGENWHGEFIQTKK